ncbi:MAG: recombinase family protein [Rhodospirillales bacterium]|nr:recombinase family protein [Rhodospirillales bacterium]
MTKLAIYARYSSDLQTDASIEDQIRVAEKRAAQEGWQVVRRYTDHGISGASMLRPGIQRMMQEAQQGVFDIVLAEALDRLSRDQEDIAGIYKRLQFAGIRIVTLSEGEINNLHIGLKGTMNALFLKDLADKTRRGLSGRIEKGKSGGGLTYGYDVVKKYDANGEPVRGERKINPELRIVEQDLWDRVKAEQGAIKKQHKEFWGKQRPRTLFSGLVKCGCCGGGMSKMSNDHLGCSTARNQGICDNLLTIRRDRLEETVLKALKTHLMDPDLCQAFCDAYTKHLNRLRMEHNAKLAGYRAEQAKLIRRSKQMVDAVAEGFRTPSLKKEMEENDARQQELEFLLSEQKESPVLVHPNMGLRYRQEIQRLIKLLRTPAHRQEATGMIRGLIDKIVLTPKADGSKEMAIDLHGDLAGILTVATQAKTPLSDADDLVRNARTITGAGDTQYAGETEGDSGQETQGEEEAKDFGNKSPSAGSAQEIPATHATNKIFYNKDYEDKGVNTLKMVAGAGFEPAAFRL